MGQGLPRMEVLQRGGGVEFLFGGVQQGFGICVVEFSHDVFPGSSGPGKGVGTTGVNGPVGFRNLKSGHTAIREASHTLRGGAGNPMDGPRITVGHVQVRESGSCGDGRRVPGQRNKAVVVHFQVSTYAAVTVGSHKAGCLPTSAPTRNGILRIPPWEANPSYAAIGTGVIMFGKKPPERIQEKSLNPNCMAIRFKSVN